MDYKKILQYTKDLHILYVEDEQDLLEDTVDILEDYFELVHSASDGLEALTKYNDYYKEHGRYYDLLITDLNMPIMSGDTLIKKIHSINPEQTTIVISAYSESEKLISLIQLGITNFILKPIEPKQFINILHKSSKDIFKKKLLIQYNKDVDDKNRNLDAKILRLTEEIIATQRISVETIGNMVESYDNDTGSHVKRIEAYTLAIVNELHKRNLCTEINIQVVPFASLLHDIGKLIVPKEILQKAGPLNKDEFEIIKTHAKLGGDLLLKANEDFKKVFGNDSYFKVAADIASYHHEKWDGSGYPIGLKGSDIPKCARIVSLVDVYDALRSNRAYKDGYSHEVTVDIIKNESGTSFDPDIVDIFLFINEEFNKIFGSSN